MTMIRAIWLTQSKPDLYQGWLAFRVPNLTQEDSDECLMRYHSKINSDLSTTKTLLFLTKLTNLQLKYNKGSKINIKIKAKATNFRTTKTLSWTWKVNLIINFHRYLLLNQIIKPSSRPRIAATYKIKL